MDIVIILALATALFTIDFNKEVIKSLITGVLIGFWLKTKF